MPLDRTVCSLPMRVCVLSYSFTADSGASWTVSCQSPLSVGFPRQEYWSGLPFPSPGDLPNSGTKPVSPALAGGFLTTEPPGKPIDTDKS